MSDRTKAELETENEKLQTSNTQLEEENNQFRTVMDQQSEALRTAHEQARCPNCGFEAAEHQALIDAATTPA